MSLFFPEREGTLFGPFPHKFAADWCVTQAYGYYTIIRHLQQDPKEFRKEEILALIKQRK
jgi:hypothetical protein